MEVSSPPKFSSLYAPHRYTGSRFLSPSKLPLCTYKGQHAGWSTNKCSIMRNYNNFATNNISCFPRRHTSVSGLDFNRKVDFNRRTDEFKLHRHHKLSTCIIARSEVARSGSPDGSYQLSGTEVQMSSRVRGVCFYAVASVVAIVLIVVMLVIHPFVLLFDRHRRKGQHFIAKIWSTLTVTPFFNTKFEGLENLPRPDTPAVYVSNHQSFLDIFTLLTLGRSFKFVSKTSIFLIPIIGWAMFLMGVIPLKRMDSRSQLDCFKRCIDLINKGASVFFFPEGTRSKDGKLGTFKKGAFSIAAKAGVPVIPITLIGTGKIMPSGLEGILNSGSVRVIIHKPIEGSDPEVLCNEARNRIANALNGQG